MPNYGILQNLNTMTMPQQGNPILREIAAMQVAAREKQAADEASAIRRAQQELTATQGKAAQAELEQMPIKLQMEQERHKANLALNATNIAATKQGMATESLRQQELRNNMQQKQADYTYKTLGGIAALPPEMQQPALNAAIKVGKNHGLTWPKDLPQDINNPETQAFLKNAYVQSGNYLNQIKQQRELAKTPMETVRNPETGKPMLVSRDQAAGMEPYKKSAGQEELDKKMAANFVQYKEDSAKNAEIGIELIKNARDFYTNYQKITYAKGPIGSVAARFSTAGQLAMQAAGKATFAEVKKLTGIATDGDMARAEKNTINVSLNPEAAKRSVETNIALGERAQEEQAFVQALSNQGIYDKGLAKLLWNKFINENELTDSKGNVNRQNIGNWQEYVSPEYIEAAKTGNLSATTKNAKTPEKTRQTSMKTGEIITAANGKKYKKVGEDSYEEID